MATNITFVPINPTPPPACACHLMAILTRYVGLYQRVMKFSKPKALFSLDSVESNLQKKSQGETVKHLIREAYRAAYRNHGIPATFFPTVPEWRSLCNFVRANWADATTVLEFGAGCGAMSGLIRETLPFLQVQAYELVSPFEHERKTLGGLGRHAERIISDVSAFDAMLLPDNVELLWARTATIFACFAPNPADMPTVGIPLSATAKPKWHHKYQLLTIQRYVKLGGRRVIVGGNRETDGCPLFWNYIDTLHKLAEWKIETVYSHSVDFPLSQWARERPMMVLEAPRVFGPIPPLNMC